MKIMTEHETRRIHFLHDVEDLGAAYRCMRCGHATGTKAEMNEHRGGIITPCFRERMKQRLGLSTMNTKTGEQR